MEIVLDSADMLDDMSIDLVTEYGKVRNGTMTLAAPLSAEDCCAQSMPDASPVKWHLAHTSWFFETFILEKFEKEYPPFHPAFRVLFNSYYNGVGEKHVRAQRGMLTRPSLDEVNAYRRDVDERIERLLRRSKSAHEIKALADLIELGLQHEKQHQELLLTDVKHLLSMNPMMPAYKKHEEHKKQIQDRTGPVIPTALEWLPFEAAIVGIGHAGSEFCFDNETPRHRQFVEQFSIASRLTTNEEYLAFIEDEGYANPSYWLSEGWDWVQTNDISHPFYWRHSPSGWMEFTLHGLQPLGRNSPATHISYFEADAYARWAQARLPTEAEWEHAARTVKPMSEANALHPSAVASGSLEEVAQLFGSVWQWTSSSYAPYPGFSVPDGAIGEYNGKFMVNQYVLRGSSCVTPQRHTRHTYRNFFPATARWQFSGIRLAR